MFYKLIMKKYQQSKQIIYKHSIWCTATLGIVRPLKHTYFVQQLRAMDGNMEYDLRPGLAAEPHHWLTVILFRDLNSSIINGTVFKTTKGLIILGIFINLSKIR